MRAPITIMSTFRFTFWRKIKQYVRETLYPPSFVFKKKDIRNALKELEDEYVSRYRTTIERIAAEY